MKISMDTNTSRTSMRDAMTHLIAGTLLAEPELVKMRAKEVFWSPHNDVWSFSLTMDNGQDGEMRSCQSYVDPKEGVSDKKIRDKLIQTARNTIYQQEKELEKSLTLLRERKG